MIDIAAHEILGRERPKIHQLADRGITVGLTCILALDETIAFDIIVSIVTTCRRN
jgi:hypothetical protein